MRKIFLLLPVLIMGCTTPQTASNQVYALEAAYAVGLRIEILYDTLPRCGSVSAARAVNPLLCAKTSVMKQVRALDDTAYAAIKDAEAAVRTPDNAASTEIIALAVAEVKAFTDVTSTLKTQ